ncbi:hypothetical protein DM82_1283 [Burkholderia oklahomensis]|uniref:Uncharacterized protein n=1 Tax=Burkholderia oklahomensis TaxID=342113 RepID=A0AAI8FN09_9BURK|nr:hypothetical protein DM82_1283 [Burkholderia oklahomensis]
MSDRAIAAGRAARRTNGLNDGGSAAQSMRGMDEPGVANGAAGTMPSPSGIELGVRQ